MENIEYFNFSTNSSFIVIMVIEDHDYFKEENKKLYFDLIFLFVLKLLSGFYFVAVEKK